MKKTYSLALHIFRRDLRLIDNSALLTALSQAEQVIPCFIFDERQLTKNDYKSENCVQFMAKSLFELDVELKTHGSHLYCFNGIAENIVSQLLQQLPIDAVYINRDYTPFSRMRDQAIANTCQQLQRHFHCYADALLHEPEQVVKEDKKPYTVFTPAFRRAQTMSVAAPKRLGNTAFYSQSIPGDNRDVFTKIHKSANPNLLVKGGRREALELLKRLSSLDNYQTKRDIPIEQHTTHLSAHNKFGTVSIREVYAAIVNTFSKEHTLIKELYWRDFFTHIAYYFPHVFSQPFHEKYSRLSWSTNEQHFQAWCEGLTGYPIVDAGMRELNTTGFMHNRVRMIVASFLTKDLHIDWRWGEKYFAQHLVDYDPAVNNGNWQWAASTGCDAQPYFRIFNPWLQQQKFDPECLYIKRWIPELAKLPPPIIHQAEKDMKKYMTNYPNPIVDHALESQKAKQFYSMLNR